MRAPRPLAPALGLLSGLAAAALLWSSYRGIPNRLSFGWDPARRTLLDLDAARALARLDLGRLLWDLAGPETWPTLRMVLAAPLLAAFGPPHAVESALAIACYAAVFPVLGLAARALAPERGAIALLAVASLALAAHRAFLAFAAIPMLEVPAGLAALAATAAWLASRDPPGPGRVWPTALLGNLLFHVKFQYGLLFAAAVLLVESASLGAEERRRAAAGIAGAARAALRRTATRAFLAGAAACGALAAAVARTGGFEVSLAGLRLSAHGFHGPLFWAAFLAFYGGAHAAWREREALRGAVPARLRALAVWLLGPMMVWLLVPFTWRLRTLAVTAAGYESPDRPAGPLGAALFYPLAMWRTWYAPPARAAVGLGLGLSAWAAARDAVTRRRLGALGAVALVEVLALAGVSRANFQERFVLDLAPLVALAAALWAPALRGLPRLAAAGALAGLLAAPLLGLWREPARAAVVAEGFHGAVLAASCRAAARALPPGVERFVNLTSADYRQDCNLWLALEARARGGWAEERSPEDPGRAPLLLVADACDPLPEGPLRSFEPAGGMVSAGEVCALPLRPAPASPR